MIERITEIIHYKKNIKALPEGNSLCYKGEKDGHGQVGETPLIEGNIPSLFSEQIFPSPFNLPEIVRRQNGK